MHVVQSDTENESGIEIERLTLPSDPLLGEPKAAAYNDVRATDLRHRLDHCQLPTAPAAGGGQSSGGGRQSAGGTKRPTKKPSKHRQKHRRGKPRLLVEKTATTGFARPSVKICDEPSSDLTILRSEPAGSGNGVTCWKLKSLGQRQAGFRLTAQIATGADAGAVGNVAAVSGANMKGVRSDSANVRVKPLPNKACGSRARRMVFAPRC